jgi:transcriptional regulator with XRE-family HTH domain
MGLNVDQQVAEELKLARVKAGLSVKQLAAMSSTTGQRRGVSIIYDVERGSRRATDRVLEMYATLCDDLALLRHRDLGKSPTANGVRTLNRLLAPNVDTSGDDHELADARAKAARLYDKEDQLLVVEDVRDIILLAVYLLDPRHDAACPVAIIQRGYQTPWTVDSTEFPASLVPMAIQDLLRQHGSVTHAVNEALKQNMDAVVALRRFIRIEEFPGNYDFSRLAFSLEPGYTDTIVRVGVGCLEVLSTDASDEVPQQAVFHPAKEFDEYVSLRHEQAVTRAGARPRPFLVHDPPSPDLS